MKCNVYEVEVVITLTDGDKITTTEYRKKMNILAISEMAAQNKATNSLKWDLKDALKEKSYMRTFPVSKLLVENVEY